MITNLVICFFSSLALFCDCSACIHQQFKGCSLKFVSYHSLLLHLTWFCRRASKRKLLLKSDLSFLFFTPLFPSCSPSKVFSLHTGKGKSSFFLVSHWIVFCFLFFWFFITDFPGVSWLSFSPYVKRNKKKIMLLICMLIANVVLIFYQSISYQFSISIRKVKNPRD